MYMQGRSLKTNFNFLCKTIIESAVSLRQVSGPGLVLRVLAAKPSTALAGEAARMAVAAARQHEADNKTHI
jgi:hypothetical protein